MTAQLEFLPPKNVRTGPINNVLVYFEVFDGPNAVLMDSSRTDSHGLANFTYVGDSTGTDSISAWITKSNGMEVRSNPVAKTWIPFPTLSLSPDSASNVVFTHHKVTAIMLLDTVAVAGETVFFHVIAGPHEGTKGDAITDSFGMA